MKKEITQSELTTPLIKDCANVMCTTIGQEGNEYIYNFYHIS